MKIFLSYRFTGQDPQLLQENITKISAALTAAGHEVWHSLDSEEHYRAKQFNNKQIMEHALQNLDQADVLLAFVNSEEKSEGMLVEIGYALARGKKFILAIQKSLQTTSIKLMASQVLEFSDLDDLCAQLKQLEN